MKKSLFLESFTYSATFNPFSTKGFSAFLTPSKISRYLIFIVIRYSKKSSKIYQPNNHELDEFISLYKFTNKVKSALEVPFLRLLILLFYNTKLLLEDYVQGPFLILD